MSGADLLVCLGTIIAVGLVGYLLGDIAAARRALALRREQQARFEAWQRSVRPDPGGHADAPRD